MAVRLTITVANITATLALGYTHIRVYRSAEYDTGFSEITTTSSLVELVSGVSSYSYTDSTGTTENWYRTTFVDINAVVDESASSASFTGEYLDTNFSLTTYPVEAILTGNDHYVVERVRRLIGDPKELTRDYISPQTGYSSIAYDQRTLAFSNPKGWPLRVMLDSQEYTTKEEPLVLDYQFITFSGATINTTSGILDVWYYHFRHPDTEILRTYNGLNPPAGMTSDQVTFELSAVLTAIELLADELRQFNATSSSRVAIFQEIEIDPTGGMSSRQRDLDSLRKRRDELIDEILNTDTEEDLYGALID